MNLPTALSEPWFSEIAPQFLVPLLRPSRTYLLKHGINLDKYDWKKRGHRPLYEALLVANDLPTALRDALAEVSEMSTPDAYNAFTELAAANDWNLGPRPRAGWSCQEIAARAFVENRAVFEQAVAQVKLGKTKIWLDYFDLDRGDLAARVTESSVGRLEARLREHWKLRKRAGFAEVRSVAVGSTLVFLISHAELTRSQTVIQSEHLKRDVIRLDPEVTDVVSYSRDTGRLSVHTRYELDARALRDLFGEVFWTDAARYQEFSIYSGVPLMERGSRALKDTGGRFTVRVKSCTLVRPDDRADKFIVCGKAAGVALDRHLKHARASGLTHISSLVLGFRFPAERAEVEVGLDDKNKVSLPRHLAQAVAIYRYLVDTGLALPPSKGARR